MRLIKEHFVPLAVRAGEQHRKDADGEFLRQCRVGLDGTGGNTAVLTASGKQLGTNPSPYCDLRLAWQQWKSLPASERAPGAVHVGEHGPIDLARVPPSPPPGGLVLKLYYRTLTRAAGKELRHAEQKDFVHNYWRGGDTRNPHVIGAVNLAIANPVSYQAQPDFLWLTEAEWKSLLLDHPSKGDSFPVPAAISDRIFRFHLVPVMAFAESIGLVKQQVRAGKLDMIVEEVAPDHVRLRLEGFAKLGEDYESATAKALMNKGAWGYEPRLLGYVEYHPTQRKITRFDLVALGDTYGLLGGGLVLFYRPGRQPLGVAFHMVDPNVPANQVFPRTGTRGNDTRGYFATGK